MTTPSPDEMKARDLCRMIAPRVKSAPAIITQALSEKTEEVERELAKLKDDPNAVHVAMLRGDVALPSISQIQHIYQDRVVAKQAAEARLSEVVGEIAETVKAHVMHGLDDYARGFREAIAVAEAAIRARFQNAA